MRMIETDYLIVGGGASAMAYVDALVEAAPDLECVVVDRRHAPGGHWLDAYPFVRLHQPSANYGVSSRMLGDDRIDAHGANAGFYERATGVEICDYFRRVLDERLIPSGRVRFLGMTEYVGGEGGLHRLVSVTSGEETEVRVRRRLVDATYVESSIPSRHRPSFGVDEGAVVVPPNELVHLASAPSGFTVLGGGKTAMDTCGWLLDQGVDPERICWVRPSELWLFNRAKTQPLDLVGSYMQLQASWVAASATATGPIDFARRLEAEDVFLRIDPGQEGSVFRGATISLSELDALRSIGDVRPARVHHVGASVISTDAGDIPNDPGRVVVDCTAAGLRPSPPRPAFEGDRITVQYLTLGYLCWSAALLAIVEAAPLTDPERNALCPPVPFSGRIGDVLYQANAVLQGIAARGAVPEIAGWNDASRLNPAAGLGPRMQDHDVVDALGRIGKDVGGAFRNLQQRAPLDRFPVT
ncbi:hypothetical protein NHL50_15315 [Acidimicrobiia bacterium EGI L10123]|uniref:NAD(P)-binding protein n=1 Tax=Salinilacustrithrix flava TaxID=2957203 RepID=UPI003D7C2B55|nr:hypothetical protein [Acidimicrobiia bacterium EGI L10123]